MNLVVVSRANKVQRFRSELAEEVLTTLDLSTLPSHIASIISKLWGIRGLCIWILDSHGELKQYGPYGEEPWESFNEMSSRIQEILWREEKEHLRHLRRSIIWRGMMILPLRAGNGVVGAVVLHCRRGVILGSKIRGEMRELSHNIGQFIRLWQAIQELQEGLLLDAPTGLYNSRYFWRRLEEEVARSRRSHAPLSVAVVDVDGMKEINDRYGHLAGDLLVAAVGKVLKTNLRVSDIVSRYGGDEFAIILLDTDKSAALQAVERIQDILKASNLQLPQGDIPFPPCSIGVALLTPGRVNPPESSSRLLTRHYTVAAGTGAGQADKKAGKPVGFPCLHAETRTAF